MDLPSSADVVIVGAGLAGLACARATVAAGLSTVVLERSDGVGGRVRTDAVDGFLLDRGFQIALLAYPELQAQLDVAALDPQRFEPGAVVWRGGALHRVADPFRQPTKLLATLAAEVGSPLDKVRVGLLRRELVGTPAADLLRRPETTTLADLQRRRFSTEMIDRFFRPLLSGIQLDPDLASTSRMFEVIFRTLAMGDTAVPAAGMGAIPAQLAAGLDDGVVHLEREVVSLQGTGVRVVDGTTVSGRAVVVAAEGPTGAALLGLDPPRSKSATCIWFAADTMPFSGRALLLDGTATGPVTNLSPHSTVAPGYAPAGRALLAAALPGLAGGGELVSQAKAQLRGWFGGQVEDWEVLRVDTIRHAQPEVRPPFVPKRRVRLGDGRYVCGDWRDTPSIQGALFSGRRCGEAVVRDLHA